MSFACLFLLKSNVTKYTFHRFQQHFKLNEKCRKSDDSIDRLLDIFQSRFQEVPECHEDCFENIQFFTKWTGKNEILTSRDGKIYTASDVKQHSYLT